MKLSAAAAEDLDALRGRVKELPPAESAERAAQAFVDLLWEGLGESCVLLRLFTSVRVQDLSEDDRRFVEKRGKDTGTGPMIKDRTPVLTLLGTRGRQPDWNVRARSQRFRCLPLPTGDAVASLSMLSAQFRAMGLPTRTFDAWEGEVASRGRADGFRGLCVVTDAATDRDDRGRMVVPAQDFVATHGVKTVLGWGAGYATAPALLVLFAFTDETVDRAAAEPVGALLDAYREATEALVRRGKVFAGR